MQAGEDVPKAKGKQSIHNVTFCTATCFTLLFAFHCLQYPASVY